MKKRLQVVMTDEAWANVDALTKEANENFDVGSISYSDVINEMILTAKLDVKHLQTKHTDHLRAAKKMVAEKYDIDTMIENLRELKSRMGKRKSAQSAEEVS